MRKVLFVLMVFVGLVGKGQVEIENYYRLPKSCYCITTQEDTVWVGTRRGMIQYLSDGTFIKHFTIEDGLVSNNHIRAIAIDSEGNKWIGTSNGISKYDGETFTNYAYCEVLGRACNVWSIAFDNSNKIYFGDLGSIITFDGNSWDKISPLASQRPFEFLVIDQENKIWWSIENEGLYCLSDNSLINHSVYSENQDYQLLANDISGISVDAQNNIWIGSSRHDPPYKSGVSMFNGTEWSHFYDQDRLDDELDIKYLYIDNLNNVWVSGSNKIVKFDGSDWITVVDNNNIEVIGQTYEDEMLFWTVKYPDYKLCKFSNDSIVPFKNNKSFPNEIVNSFTSDRHGNIWYASKQEFGKFNGTTWENYPANFMIYDLKFDLNDNLWLGFTTIGSGIGLWDGINVREFYEETGFIDDITTCLTLDNNGNIWAGTKNGVARFNENSWQKYDENNNLPSNSINCILTDKTGNIWVGTDNGVSLYKDGVWTNFSLIELSLENKVSHIAVDTNNSVWICFNGKIYKKWKIAGLTRPILYLV